MTSSTSTGTCVETDWLSDSTAPLEEDALLLEDASVTPSSQHPSLNKILSFGYVFKCFLCSSSHGPVTLTGSSPMLSL